MSECQACGEEIRSDRTLCPNCRNRLRNVLDDLADAWAESLTTLTRQDARGGTGGGSGTPLPFNATMSERRDEIRQGVIAWVLELNHGHVSKHHLTFAGLVQQIKDRLDYVAVFEHAGRLVEEVEDWVRRLRTPTDRAPDRIIVGRCEPCGQPITDTHHVDAAVCPLCAAVVDVKGQRDARLAEARQQSATIPELARYLSGYCRRTVTERTVARWVRLRLVRADFTGRVNVGAAMDLADRLAAPHKDSLTL